MRGLSCLWPVLLLTPVCADYIATDYTITGASISLTADLVGQLGMPSNYGFSFSPGVTSVRVDACLPGYYSYDDAQTCTACPAGKYSPTNAAPSIDTCLSCESGKYSATLGANSSATCLDCPTATYFPGTAGASLAVCLACPANSSSYPGSKLLQACVCNGGYSGPNGGACSPCNSSVWCLYGQANPCPSHSRSNPLSFSLAQCLCSAGYYGDASLGGPDLTICQVRTGITIGLFIRPEKSKRACKRRGWSQDG